MKNFKVECAECGKKGSFNDEKDITYSKWKIIAWKMKENEPLCVCENCEYGSPKEKVKKK